MQKCKEKVLSNAITLGAKPISREKLITYSVSRAESGMGMENCKDIRPDDVLESYIRVEEAARL